MPLEDQERVKDGEKKTKIQIFIFYQTWKLSNINMQN